MSSQRKVGWNFLCEWGEQKDEAIDGFKLEISLLRVYKMCMIHSPIVTQIHSLLHSIIVYTAVATKIEENETLN